MSYLSLKLFHHCLMSFIKKPSNKLRCPIWLNPESNGPIDSLTRLHLMVTYMYSLPLNNMNCVTSWLVRCISRPCVPHLYPFKTMFSDPLYISPRISHYPATSAISLPLYLHPLQWFSLNSLTKPHYNHKIIFYIPIYHLLRFFLNYQIPMCTEIEVRGYTQGRTQRVVHMGHGTP